MSQWSSIIEKGLYGVATGIYQHYPIDARGALAVWLEEHVESSQLNPEVDSEEWFRGFMLQMTEELGRQINSITATEHHWLTYKNVLQNNLTFIQQRYGNDPISLFRTLKHYMEQERRLLNPAMPETPGAVGIMMNLNDRVAPSSSIAGLLSQKDDVLQQLGLLLDGLGSTRQRIVGLDESVNPLSNGIALFRDQLRQEMTRAQDEMQRMNHDFHYAMVELGRLQAEILKQFESLNEEVQKELDCWIVEQRRAANGFSIERNLDEIESLFVYIAHGLVQTYQDVVKAEGLQQNAVTYVQMEYPRDVYQHHQHIKSQVLSMIQTLVTKTFIVETQPFQVIRSKAAPTKQRLSTVTNPSIRLRLLVGSALNPSLIVPVKASLISEKEAKKHHENPKAALQPKVKLVNDKSELCCDKNTQKYVAEFRGVTLATKIERRTKKSSKAVDAQEQEFVAAEKWCFLFKAEFTILNLKIPIETSSNPVCITCHPNQDYISWGSLLWDNEFAEPNRIPFEVVNVVDCERLLNVLSQKFLVQTGRGLSSDHRRFLTYKLLGNAPANSKVSWELFNKKAVTIIETKKGQNKPVTFWEYIYEILKLCEQCTDPKKQDEVNQHFQKYWAEGRIEGFIFREDMEKKLRDTKCDGIFMLRFSDNCPGSVTVNLYKSTWDIQKFEPYSLEDLSKGLPLWNRISTKSCLTCLYPNIPKDVAFPEPKSTRNDSKSHLYRLGYVRTYMDEKIDMTKIRSRHLSTSSASTSTSYFPSSGPSSSAPFTPHSLGSVSPPSAGGGFHESSENYTSHDQYSSSMDEDDAAFRTTKL